MQYNTTVTTQCPHCHAKCKATKTQQITEIYREVTFTCTNENCGCVFVAAIEPVRLLSLPANPDPAIKIPLSRHISKEKIEAMFSILGERKIAL